MTSPIYDELERLLGHAGLELHDDADRVKTWLTRHIHPHPYHQQQQNTERTPAMSLLDTALAKVEDLDAHLRALAAHDVPMLETLQSSKIVQAIEGFVLTPQAEEFIAATVGFLAQRYAQQPAAPVADAAPVDASQPAPAA